MFLRENSFAWWRELASEGAYGVHREVERRLRLMPTDAVRSAISCLLPEDNAASRRGSLAGIPFMAKDLFATRAAPTAAGSSFFAETQFGVDADAEMLADIKALGMHLVGKTHLVEFAFGMEGTNPHVGDVCLPHAPDRLIGGSSSGSAWVVRAGIVPFATGTDTAGSIRVPAAFAGIYGLRLRPGERWITEGVWPLSPSHDTAGWMTANKRDMATAITALCKPKPVAGTLRGLFYCPGEATIHPETSKACAALADKLGAATNRDAGRALDAAFVGSADAYVVLSSAEAWDVHRDLMRTYRDRYGSIVRERIERGSQWTEADLGKARSHREVVGDAFGDAFVDYDFIATPVIPGPAPTREDMDAALRRELLHLNTPVSLAGLPALTIPVPLPSGLSAGIQIVYRNTYSPVPVEVLGVS